MESDSDHQVYEKLVQLRAEIDRLSAEHDSLGSAARQAGELLDQMRERRSHLLTLNKRLAVVSADSAELLADLEVKNEALSDTNRELARANANAAELMGEIEHKNDEIGKLNHALSHSNALAAELLAELELSKVALEQTSAEKSKLLGIVAHDMRSGIGGICGLAELIRSDFGPDRSEASQYLELIESASGQLLELLTSLLEVSSLDQGKLELHPDIIDFNRIIQEAIKFHSPFAGMKEQSLGFELDETIGEVYLDQYRMRQACDNLLSNAIKYSRCGGSIRVVSWCRDHSVCVSVYDDGPGLNAEDMTKVFQPFQKLSPRPTSEEDSHGLGLAITKQLIDLHAGEIWVENMPSGGCCFSFSIPVDRSR